MIVPEQDTRFRLAIGACDDGRCSVSGPSAGLCPNHQCTKKEIRCAVKGNMHLTYWFKPPNNGPCSDSGLYKKPTRNPTHAPTNAPATSAPSSSAPSSSAPSSSAPTTHPCDNGSHGCDSGPGGVCISTKKGAKVL